MEPQENCNPRVSRKKSLPDPSSSKSCALHTSSLKLDFLANDNGLVSQLRVSQLEQVLSFFKAACRDPNACRTLLNVGAPGTGKTSVIKQALARFKKHLQNRDKQTRNLCSLRIISFNSHSISKCQELGKQLRNMAENCQTKLRIQQTFLNPDEPIIINIIWAEEIDKIIEANNSESLKDFFEVFTNGSNSSLLKASQKHLKLQNYLLIGTSNTINLQQSIIKKIGSRKIITILYPPYSIQSLIKIAQGRIQVIKQHLNIELRIPDKIIKFIVMKLRENKKDDTRNLIELIKEVLLSVENRKQIIQALQKDETGLALLTMESISSIPKIRAVLNPSKAGLLEKLNFKQQLVMALIYEHIKNNEALEIPEQKLVEQFRKKQKSLGISAYEDVKTAINELQTYGCIQIRSKKNLKSLAKADKSASKISIILKISLQDIENAISANPILSEYFP